MKHANFLVLTVLLLSAGCGQDTLTGIDTDTEGGSLAIQAIGKNEIKMVPAKGTYEGYGWFDLSRPGCPTGSLPLAGIGGGHSTLLGAYEVKTEYCSYAQVDPTNPTFIGTDTLTVASGDKVYSTFWGYSTSPVDYVQIETITGGTGRFENVSGSLTAIGTFGPHPVGFSMEATFAGEVTSIGSSK